MKKRLSQLCLFIIAMVLFAMIGYGKTFFIDSDVFWHLKLGEIAVNEHKLINTAVGTYASHLLPYVPHELLFQIIIYAVKELGGWAGVYILFGLSYLIFVLGIFKLSEINRKENGKDQKNDFLNLLLLIYFIFTFFAIVDFKVISISISIVIWYVIWLKKFINEPTHKKAIILGLFSLFLSNFHGGTWIVSFVFYLFALINAVLSKKMKFVYITALLLVLLGGVLNVGGLNSIMYAWEVGNYKSLLVSFQPVNFANDKIHFVLFVIFLLCAKFLFEKSWFEKLFILGILYLGLSSLYQFIYLIILLPYFMSVAIEYLPIKQEEEGVITQKYVLFLMTIGIALVTIIQLSTGTYIDKSKFPVTEMQYIKTHYQGGNPPKILADYVESGYLFYQGAEILADPRLDPFITKQTTNKYGWNALQRQLNAFKNGFLIEEIQYQKPDFVILPKLKQSNTYQTAQYIMEKKEMQRLGKPVFKGSYGYVFKIN